MPPSLYRSDIDGLRAISVAAVLIFHAFPSVLTGGFTGVDVFFVISGYLISGIIIRRYENNTFSAWQFYGNRIRRLFPALITVLLFCFIAGPLFFSRTESRNLNLHISLGSIFGTNFFFFF